MTTNEYASSELKKYADKVIDGEYNIELRCTNEGNPFDDVFSLSIKNGKGYIEGSNPRALLLGVYKFFYELGCRFVRPRADGEILVRRKANDCTVEKTYRPKNRYRGICSEGAISIENVVDMIEWLPKVGMNSYFLQFVDGHLFFEKWYAHKGSSVLSPEPYSIKQSAEHFANAVEAIKKCGLIYQAVGHGWTTEPLGYITYGDTRSKDEDIKEEDRELFALIGEKRGFYRDMPGDTQLCYSKKKARDVVTDAIAAYLKAHPETDVLHFWLADGMGNHCECEDCKKRLPSEWYVTMLNELDEKLEKANIQAKVAFLLYCDLLFAPRDEKLKNPDRFIMMYAPIARNYFDELYTDKNFERAKKVDIPFRWNKNSHPTNGGEYLYFLNNWQKQIACDSFVFDYHLMTFEYGGDPSALKISTTVYKDMSKLYKANLNGNISCQLQRIFLPTSLPNYVMAESLFGTERGYEEIETECLQTEYGKEWEKVKAFLYATQKFYLSDEVCKQATKEERLAVVEEYEQVLLHTEEWTFADEDKTVDRSLKNLRYFINMQRLFIAAYKKKASDGENISEIQALNKFIDENELFVQPYEDSLFRKEGFKSWL